MYDEIEKSFLYNPFDVKSWTDAQIEEQVRKLIPRYDANDDTMYGMAKNVETLANIMYLFGEMIARITKEHALIKLDVDVKEDKAKVEERKMWVEKNPGAKVPSINYFEALASDLVKNLRSKQLDKYEQLTRFKYSYDSYENIMNAIKKKMEAIKYEEFNK